MTRKRSGYAWALVAVLIAVAGFAPATVQAGTGGSEKVVPFASSGYRYDTVEPGGTPGFEVIDFDDSGFADGSAMFGTSNGCAVDETLATPWEAGDDLLVRRDFALPDDDRELRIGLILLQDAEVFVNGESVTDGFVRADDDFCPARNSVVISVPDALLVRGGANTLAIRARAPAFSDPNRSAPAYLDAEIRLVEAPSNDHRAAATVVDALPFLDVVGMEGATLEPDEPMSEACQTMPDRTVWYRFTPTVDGPFVAGSPGEIEPGLASPIVAHYIEDAGGALTLVGCEGGGLDRPFHAEAGVSHLFQVGLGEGWWYATASVGFRMSVAPPIEPSFWVNPDRLEAGRLTAFHGSVHDPAGGQPIAWAWDFGDGARSDQQDPAHQYAGAGDYDVRLDVTMGDGRTGTTTRTLTVFPFEGGPLEPSFWWSPENPIVDVAAQLQDASYDPDGQEIVGWSWDFGDGATSDDQHPTHAWASPGEFDVALTVTSADGRTAATTRTITVVEAPDPVADFSFWPDVPTTAGPAQFYDGSYDPAWLGIVAWSWDFGDGSTSAEQYPAHTFSTPGDYTVALTVTTVDGRSASTTRGLTVTVPPDPIADMYWYPYDPSIVDTVQFGDASWDPAGAGITSWAWDFGDGGTSTDQNPTHRYAANGTYQVSLNVATIDGRTASTSQVVTVATHDVAIKAITAPKSASSGQTKSINVDLVNRRQAERAEVTLFRSTANGYEYVASRIVDVPLGKSTRVSFDVTFTSADALLGKVTFRAYVSLLDARDAIPADNEAISSPTKVNR